jgi:Ala-tRNA(Pro) deacylase
MTTAATLKTFLKAHDARFEIVDHPRQIEATRIAQSAHITGKKLAKGVLLSNGGKNVLAVLPSTHTVDLNKISRLFGKRLRLASEKTISSTFPDCDEGAIPACGMAYGLDVFMDDELMDREDIYFEAGDHESLVHVTRSEFSRLMPGTAHGNFAQPN